MIHFSIELLLLLLSFIFCSAISLRFYMLKTKAKKTVETLTNTKNSLNKLQNKLDTLSGEQKEAPSFDTSLQTAALTTNLQKSRSQYHNQAATITPPERYRYIRSLLENGLDSTKIAAVLAISLQEAEQLVTLVRLSQKKEASLSNTQVTQ